MGGGGVKKTLRNTNGGSCQMLTFDDMGGGVEKSQKPAYVIHGCSLTLHYYHVNFLWALSSIFAIINFKIYSSSSWILSFCVLQNMYYIAICFAVFEHYASLTLLRLSCIDFKIPIQINHKLMGYYGWDSILMITMISRKIRGGYKIMRHTAHCLLGYY